MADTLLSMAEAAKADGQMLKAGVMRLIVEENPMFEKIMWTQLAMGQGSYGWWEDGGLSSAAFRAVNASWEADVGHILHRQEGLAILGGEVKLDRFLQTTTGAGGGTNISLDQKAIQFEMKARATKLEWEQNFFEGDTGINLNAFDGMRPRALEGTIQALDISNAGDADALTLDDLDQAFDLVRGGPNGLAMNQFLRRKVNALVRAAGQAREVVSTSFGEQLPAYANVPMWVTQREDTQVSILGFDEDPGDAGNDSASIYALRFGNEEDVFGILGAGGAWEVVDFGEIQSAPQHLGRLEVYCGLAVKHRRSACRIHGAAQA